MHNSLFPQVQIQSAILTTFRSCWLHTQHQNHRQEQFHGAFLHLYSAFNSAVPNYHFFKVNDAKWVIERLNEPWPQGETLPGRQRFTTKTLTIEYPPHSSSI